MTGSATINFAQEEEEEEEKEKEKEKEKEGGEGEGEEEEGKEEVETDRPTRLTDTHSDGHRATNYMCVSRPALSISCRPIIKLYHRLFERRVREQRVAGKVKSTLTKR